MDDITPFLEDKEIRKALEKIVRYEEKKRKECKTDPIWRGMRDLKSYWSWQDVCVHWSIVHELLSADIIEAYGGWTKEYLLVKRSAVKEVRNSCQ